MKRAVQSQPGEEVSHQPEGFRATVTPSGVLPVKEERTRESAYHLACTARRRLGTGGRAVLRLKGESAPPSFGGNA